MSQQHLQGFLTDIRTINPQININDRFGSRTSLSGLITHLQTTVNAPVSMTALEARQRCANSFAPGIAKYAPAIDRLTSVWGRGAHRVYPNALNFVPVVNHLNLQAQQNFNNNIANVPVPLRPTYAALEHHDDNPWAFGANQGPGYLHRVVVAGQPPLDITSRGLLLKAGLTPPTPAGTDNGYIASLQLTDEDLTRMQGTSILDIGCGAAIFRAEMEALYGCDTTGIDLNHAHVGAAIANGQSRYVHSTFYLKMMKDKALLARTTVPVWASNIIDQQVTGMPNILTAFANNLPIQGDVFNLGALNRRWDFTTCTFMLCYFNPDQQTDAILNMGIATKRRIFLYSGQGLVLNPTLNYDQDQIRRAFPGCQIVVKDQRTHHIILR